MYQSKNSRGILIDTPKIVKISWLLKQFRLLFMTTTKLTIPSIPMKDRNLQAKLEQIVNQKDSETEGLRFRFHDGTSIDWQRADLEKVLHHPWLSSSSSS